MNLDGKMVCPHCYQDAIKTDQKIQKLFRDRDIGAFMSYLKELVSENPEAISNYNETDSSDFQTLRVSLELELTNEETDKEFVWDLQIECSNCDASFRYRSTDEIESYSR